MLAEIDRPFDLKPHGRLDAHDRGTNDHRGQRLLNPQKIQLLTGPVITPEIAAGLQPRSWYTPWDRTHMYPNYREHYAGGPLRRWHARRRARFAAGA